MLTGKFVIFIFGLLTKITTDSATSAEYIFPCYYVYEPENLSPEQVPAFDLCTHVILIGCTGEVVGSNEVQVHSSPVDCKTGLRKVGILFIYFLFRASFNNLYITKINQACITEADQPRPQNNVLNRKFRGSSPNRPIPGFNIRIR